jgi:hypothetical protein
MNDEQELRTRLATVETPASRVKIDQVVTVGRRRTFRRRAVQTSGGLALAAAVLLAVPGLIGARSPGPAVADGPGATASPSSPTQLAMCQVRELPAPPGVKGAFTYAVDSSGRYVVGNYTVGQNFRAILWIDGQPVELPLRGSSVQATAVNSSGVVAGLVYDETTRTEYAFRYQNGQLIKLFTPAGKWHVYAWPRINSAGDVVLNAEPKGKIEGEDSIALLWKAGSTKAVQLPLPTEANVFDITDDGTLVGNTYQNGHATGAYAWDQQGNGRKLAAPAGITAYVDAARGDWATGALGSAAAAKGPTPADKKTPTTVGALWNLRTGALTQLPTYGTKAVNSSGWAITDTNLVREGVLVDLGISSEQFVRLEGISDSGLLVGSLFTKTPSDLVNVGPRVWQC